MASYLNAPERTNGAVLVLPLDDFYQMPYQFGFYGSDSFITNLIDRHVLLPVPQGYFKGTPGLASTVALDANYLQNRDWARGARLLSILGVSYVLLRGDIVSSPGRGVDLPSNYATLFSDPLLRLDHAFGPLSLFATNVQAETGTRTTNAYWTVDLPNIDPHMLADLPLGVHLVAHKPIPGVPTLVVDRHAALIGSPLIVQISGNVGPPGPASKPPSLTISEDGYSDGWSGPGGGERVAVDGLFNGWIARSTTPGQIAVVYTSARYVNAGVVATLVAVALSVLYLLASWPFRRFRVPIVAVFKKVRRGSAKDIGSR